MSYGIFDLQQKRRMDGTGYVSETLLAGCVFQTPQAAQDALARLRQSSVYSWRRMGVRELRPGDLARTLRPSPSLDERQRESDGQRYG
jgi:hypothetical protein